VSSTGTIKKSFPIFNWRLNIYSKPGKKIALVKELSRMVLGIINLLNSQKASTY
jgi:hypothetical protein